MYMFGKIMVNRKYRKVKMALVDRKFTIGVKLLNRYIY